MTPRVPVLCILRMESPLTSWERERPVGRVRCLSACLFKISPDSPVCGQAFTWRCSPGGNGDRIGSQRPQSVFKAM